MIRLLPLLLLCACAHGFDTRTFDGLVREAQENLEVPGAAIAVVRRDGTVVYERVLGVQELDREGLITADTRFLMGSVTKPMTTLLDARLIDQHRFDWSTKVTTLLPDFALGDPALTAALELWHMSCGCTGMPRRDLEHLFEFTGVTPEQRLAEMQQMRPTTALGATFQYSNLMFAAGGYAAAHALFPELPLKQAFARAMQEQLFTPAGMQTATVDFDEAVAGEHASPHALDVGGNTVPLPIDIERNVETIAPAGAVWASVRDMERYASLELARGRGVVSATQVERRWKRVTGTDADGYGLGMDVSDGVLSHDGGSMGFGTSLLLLPGDGLALVVLTNVRNGDGREQLPFNAFVKTTFLQLVRGEATAAAPERRAAATSLPPRHIDPALAGVYESPTLGRIEIHDDVLDAGEWQVRFDARHESMLIVDPPFAGTELPLRRSAKGVEIVIPDEQPVVFHRVEP